MTEEQAVEIVGLLFSIKVTLWLLFGFVYFHIGWHLNDNK